MKKEKLYSILTNVKLGLWVLAVIFGLIGTSGHKNLFMQITAYILFILGISQIIMYLYFKKSSDLGYQSKSTTYDSLILSLLSLAEFYGAYYILVNFA